MLHLWTALWLAASTANPDLAAAEHAFSEGRFQDVLAPLQRALKNPLSTEQRQTALEVEAFTFVAFDRTDDARSAFKALLDLDPAYQPPEPMSPKVRAAFTAARGQWQAERPKLAPSGGPTTPAPSAALAAPALDLTADAGRPAPAAAPPLWKQWWVWTAVGVVVAGVTTVLVVEDQRQIPNGTLGQGVLK